MITYRRANTKDIDGLVMLRLEFLKEASKVDSNENDQMLAGALAEYFLKTVVNDDFVAWLALDGDNIVGTSGLCFYAVPPSYKNTSGKTAYIMNMYTKPMYRSRGIASELFAKVVSEAKGMGSEKITLNATEMGRPIYRKFGFKETDDEMVLYL